MSTRSPRRSASGRPSAPDAAERIVLRVGPPAHGGHCVARPDGDPAGRVVFVRHALPGETVRAVLTEKNAKIWRADAIEVLSASPDRVRPLWPEAGPGGVGGGELSHVALPAQRTWKRWVLADCLRRIGGEEVAAAAASLPEARGAATVPVEPMPGDAEAGGEPRASRWAGAGTRTRVALSVTDDGLAGMHGFRSGRVLPVTSLPLAVSAIRDLGLTERALWRRRYRPGMRVRAVAPSAGEPVVLLSDAEGDRVLTAAGRPTGRRRVEEVVDASGLGLGELRYSVHVSGFWQVHRDAPAALVERVVRAAVPDPARAGAARVLELYSGAGLLTLPLAALGCEIRSLEADERAVRDARRTLHDFGAARLHVGRAGADSVASLGSGFGPGRDGRADVVVLDPPRRGAGREVVEAVAALRPRRIVLVGCDPAALARDLRTFIGRGCRIVAMSALDMFPHTHHFETIAVLEGA